MIDFLSASAFSHGVFWVKEKRFLVEENNNFNVRMNLHCRLQGSRAKFMILLFP